jgi:hypothetical protein
LWWRGRLRQRPLLLHVTLVLRELVLVLDELVLLLDDCLLHLLGLCLVEIRACLCRLSVERLIGLHHDFVGDLTAMVPVTVF